MAMEMNRRTFMKTTAAAAVAVSLTGLLGGCGGAADSGIKLNGYTISINMKNAKSTWGKTAGAAADEGTGYFSVPLKLTAGSGLGVNTTMGIFSGMTSVGDALTLENKYNTVVLVQNVPTSVEVSFSTKDKKVYEALDSGSTTLLLNVNPTGGDRAVQYTINFATAEAIGKVIELEDN